MKHLAVRFGVVLTVLGLGCGGETAEPTTAPGPEAVEAPAPSADVEVLTIEGAPQDVPAYPGVEAQVEKRGDAVSVSGQTQDQPKDVYEFYKKALLELDWTIEAENRMGSNQTLTARKHERMLLLYLTGDGTRTEIGLLISPTS